MVTGPLADTDDVETALLRPLTANETVYVPGLIDQATVLLRTRAASIDDRIAKFQAGSRVSPAVDPLAVAAMLAQVVKRYMVNVDGATSKTQSAGPFSQTTSFSSYGKTIGGATGQLEITDDDLASLNPANKSQIGSIKVKAALAPGRLERSLRHHHYRDC